MQRNTHLKLIIGLMIFAILIVSGCDGGSFFGGGNSGKCSSGDACVYYSGSEGIRMIPESLPTTLYFNERDIGRLDANSAEFNVRLENQGASYAYGATFIEGFDPNLFRIQRYSKGQWIDLRIDRTSANCYFDILSFSSNGLGMTAGCYGIDGSVFTPGGNWNLDFDLQKIGALFGETDLPALTLRLDRNSGDNWLIGVGYDGNILNVLQHGMYLMGLVSRFDFEKYGGTIIAMRGDNADSPGGDIDYHRWKIQLTQPWPAGEDYIRIPYQIKSCYAYTTFVSPMVCVDPDPYSNERKTCTSQSYSWGGSQGAPVAVTRMEQTNTGSEVIMDFTIRNVNSGTVWDAGKLEACSPYFPGRVTSDMHNVVYIGQAWIGNKPIDCSRQISVRLDPNTKQARFTCVYDYSDALDIGGGYATPLKMELWYGYEEVIQRQLTMRKIG